MEKCTAGAWCAHVLVTGREIQREQSVCPFDRDRGEIKVATSMGAHPRLIRIFVVCFLRSGWRNISVDMNMHPVAVSKDDRGTITPRD